MSPEILILLVGLVVLMAVGIPITFALMSVASVILIIFFGPAQMNVLNAAFVNQMQSESLLAIPMFALMASFLQTSGIGSDIYEFFHKWMGGINGGLAMATVATTAVIAAMSGVAATATIMMGLIALPEMINRGYDKALATGPVLAGGCLGPIIPPSTIMIIMASYTGVSAGWLFAGGVLPGVGLAILFILYIGIRCALNPKLSPGIPKAERPSWGEKLRVFKKVVAPIAIIVLVLGCIYAGIATPTEAAGVGAFASLVYALITRKLTFKNLRGSLIQTMEVSAMLMWILMGGAAYNSLVNITRLSDVVAAAFQSAHLDGLPLMLLIFALFFVMGMFLDTTPIIMIAIPILLPIIRASSLDVNATILILCITLCLGMITPPFGINMFYLQGVAPPGVDTKVMYKAVIPYVIFKNLRGSLIQTMEVSAMLMWILMGGAAYNSLVNITRLSDVVAAAFQSAHLDGLPLMLLIFALFFVMGMFLDTTPIIMIAIPILLPIIRASSLDVNATILILCITLCLGMITPPFGINMFYLQGVAPPGVDTKVMYKAVIPYVIIFLIACFFMMLFPELIVIFPNAAMGY